MKKYTIFLHAFALLLALAACGAAPESPGSAEGEYSFTDDLGRTVTLDRPERVAALIGSYADVWCLAGGRDTLAAAANDAWTSFDLGLDDSVANLGAIKEPSLETLLSAEPDFVLASCNTAANLELMDVLESAGIPTAYFDVQGFEDYLNMLDICTALTGERENYQTYGLDVQSEIESAVARADGSAPTVLVIRATGVSCKVKGSEDNVLGEMLAALGCVNIADSDSSLLEELNALGSKAPNTERQAKIAQLRADWDKEIVDLAMVPGTPMNPRRVLLELSRMMPENAILCTDIGNVASTANSYFRFTKPRKHIAALTFGNTGFAYPAGLGAKLASPDDPVVCIIGDGAWGMSLHEISSAIEHKLPVIACVFRNGAWCAEKKNQVDFFNSRFIGVDIPNPVSFVPVAKALGANGERIEKPEDIAPAFERALKSDVTTILEFVVDGTQLAPPFRRDAFQMPTRYLDQFAHLDYRRWMQD